MDALRDALTPDPFPSTVDTPAGPVMVERMALRSLGDAAWVEVTVADPEGGDPLFRVFNPPTGADPVAEVAHAVALNGGRYVDRSRR
jgi:hypothetical protein